LLADAGNNLIIDEVILNDELFTSYKETLKMHSPYFVGVYCDLPTMQKREKTRQDRHIGLSNDQFDKVHENKHYDLMVHTNTQTAEEVAKQILLFISNNRRNP
jgi:chloramphenicol 3-O phosphotransferase